MSGSYSYFKKQASDSTAAIALSTSEKTINFNFDCGGTSTNTLDLASLKLVFSGKLSTVGTGASQWCGAKLGSNSIVKKLVIIINNRDVVDIDDWNHYTAGCIKLNSDYGILDTSTRGKMDEYYPAQTLSSTTDRVFFANISNNGLSKTKHIIDLSQLNTFKIRITYAKNTECIYNTTGDARFTISADTQYIQYVGGKPSTIDAGDILTFEKVHYKSITSATKIDLILPNVDAICMKKCHIHIAGAVAGTTNTNFTSDSSTITGIKINLPSLTYPNGGINSEYVKPDLYLYSQNSYHNSNPHYFTSSGLEYDAFYTASSDGFLCFDLANISSDLAEKKTAKFNKYGLQVGHTSTITMTQSAVTIAGLTYVFTESLCQFSLNGVKEVTIDELLD